MSRLSLNILAAFEKGVECAITSVSVDLRRSDLGVSIYELQIRIMSSDTFKTLVAQVENSNNLFEIILLLIVVMFLSWIGIGYPLNACLIQPLILPQWQI